MPEPSPLMADRVLVGRYRVLRLVARGGMAEVWEGYDEVLARPVAIKVLHPHLAADEAFAERFRREAIAAARLAHPSIVATFDTGTDGDVAFIVMELVPGRTLRQALEESGTLPATMAVAIATEVADALEHAHQAGLVHRDIKPANILLAEHEGATAPLLQVKVADFGIAKLQTPPPGGAGDLTQPGAVVGTAKYLSPEQVQGRAPDARSDVYALGVVLYEMLSGRAPFEAETELATALQHVRAEPPSPRRFHDAIPAALEDVVLRALAKDPSQRFGSAAELRDALASVDLGPAPDDDAVPQVVRDPTPPAGVTTVSPRPPPPAARLAPLALLVGLVAVVLLTAAVLLGDSDEAATPGGGSIPAPGGGEIRVAAVRSFDPEGDGEENEPRARLATDGDPASSWNTDRYNSRAFGGLKAGVGLVLQLGEAADLRRLQVRSSTSGWAAAVYVADRPADRLAGWGQPVASRSGIVGSATFDLRGRRGAAVLVWITDPGTRNRAEVAEVALQG